VGNEESRSSLAGTNDTHNWEQEAENAKDERAKEDQGEQSKNNLKECQEINKSRRSADEAQFSLSRLWKFFLSRSIGVCFLKWNIINRTHLVFFFK